MANRQGTTADVGETEKIRAMMALPRGLVREHGWEPSMLIDAFGTSLLSSLNRRVEWDASDEHFIEG